MPELVAGSGVTLTEDTGAGTLTVAANGGVITPQQFYEATDPDFQNAMEGAVAYLKTNAVNPVAGIVEGSPQLFIPANTMAYDMHAPVYISHTLDVGGEDTGFHDGHATKFKWTNGTCGFVVEDYNTTGTTGTYAGGFGGAGSRIHNIFGKGGLDLSSTEGEFHFILARARVIVENCAADGWQGDGVAIIADVSAPAKGEASLSQVKMCRLTNLRNGVVPKGGDANVVNIESVDVVYARRWAFPDQSFLSTRMQTCHASGCGFFNPGYTPSLCTYSGNTYAVVAGQETGASTNAPSGTTADNAYWYYCYAGGASAPLNIMAWTSGLTWLSGGGFYVSGASASSTLDDCYTETGMGPSQLPYLSMAVGGTHGAGVRGARLGAHNGEVAVTGAISVEQNDFVSTIRTTVGSGENTADRSILSHHNAAIGGANVLGFGFPTFSPNVLYWSNWRGSFTDDLIPFQISMNAASVGDAPWGVNRMNLPLGFGFGGKKRYPATAIPATARLVGDVDENTAPTATTPLKWITTVAGTPGTQILHYPYLRANASVGVGYVTGAGGAVTQLTDKSTATPAINKVCGQITMNGAALAAGAKVSFIVTNSTVAATDTIIVSVASGGTANAYRAAVTAINAGVSFTVTVENITAGSLSEAPVINFAILKAVAA